LSNVTLTGFLEFDAWAYLLTQCDAAFNAALPEALIYLPNKFFYYLAAGVAVLNTIPGQCSRIIREGGCGLDYRAGEVESCVRVVEDVIRNPEARREMQKTARDLAERLFDRRVLYQAWVSFIEG
jgi:glycosyltransferase involved in cell wall biosynthesis